jgi:GNAT superfamily N-acetyltransferase
LRDHSPKGAFFAAQSTNIAMVQFQTSLMRAERSHESIVQTILEAAPTYYQRVEGVSPVPTHMARKEMEGKPTRQSASYEKHFLIASLENFPFGIVDLHRNHPGVGDAYIGLLLIRENKQAIGVGRALYDATERYIRCEFGAKRIVLGVADDNDVSGFWKKMGFVFNAKTYTWTGERRTGVRPRNGKMLQLMMTWP